MKFYVPLLLALATSAFAQESSVVDGTTVVENDPTTTFSSTTVGIDIGDTSVADTSTTVVTSTIEATAVVPAVETATSTETDVVIVPTTVATTFVTDIVATTTTTQTTTTQAVATVIVASNETAPVVTETEDDDVENGAGRLALKAGVPLVAAGLAAVFVF